MKAYPELPRGVSKSKANTINEQQALILHLAGDLHGETGAGSGLCTAHGVTQENPPEAPPSPQFVENVILPRKTTAALEAIDHPGSSVSSGGSALTGSMSSSKSLVCLWLY